MGTLEMMVVTHNLVWEAVGLLNVVFYLHHLFMLGKILPNYVVSLHFISELTGWKLKNRFK